jgi:hypothetical protein
MSLKSGFVLHPDVVPLTALRMDGVPGNNLGPLQPLIGTWVGTGFNNIWRANQSSSGRDNVLQLNATSETLQFTEIPGNIPNRGLLQPDIVMFGLTYLQQVSDANANQGIHIEPGIWAVVPPTSDPLEPQTVVRMASIPHGTTVLAQGTAVTSAGGPIIPAIDITPSIGGNLIPFPDESTLSQPSNFRLPSAAQPENPPLQFPITQAMVNDPNSVLKAAIVGQNIIQTTTLSISTNAQLGLPPPTATPAGGGTDNTAFLNGNGANSSAPGSANAQAFQMDATFWIETVKNPDGSTFLQLQYSQKVILNFNGLSWPHVSVATLKLQQPVIHRFASVSYPGVYLRLDGQNVGQPNPLGGTVNGQFGAFTWERYNVIPQDDGSSTIASVQFPGVFLSLDGAAVNPGNPVGGNVQAAWGVGPNSTFFVRQQDDGTVAIESASFPHVFLSLTAPDLHARNGAGGGTAQATWGIANDSKFYYSA